MLVRGGLRRAARRKRGDAACLVAVVAVDAIEVTKLGEPSEQFQALLVGLRLLEPLPSAGGTSSCVASLIALLALAHEAASAVLIAQKRCCHGLVLFKAVVLAGGHHERQLLCGLCAGRLLLSEVPLVKQVRRRGWGGVGAHWRQCRGGSGSVVPASFAVACTKRVPRVVAGRVGQQRLPYFLLLSFDGTSNLLGFRFELLCLWFDTRSPSIMRWSREPGMLTLESDLVVWRRLCCRSPYGTTCGRPSCATAPSGS